MLSSGIIEGSPTLPARLNLRNRKVPRSLWFRDRERLVFLQARCQHLFATRRPVDLHAIDLCRVAQAEIQRQNTLRQITRLAVVISGIRLPAGVNTDRGAKPVAVRARAVEHDFEPMNLLSFRQVADEYLRFGIEVIDHDVQIAVVVEVENGGGPAGTRRHDDGFSGVADTDSAVQLSLLLDFPRIRTVDLEPRRVQLLAGFDPQHEFRVQELLAVVIQKQGVYAVAVGITHARGNVDVLPAVRVEIADTRSPRPIGFQSQAIGDFLE